MSTPFTISGDLSLPPDASSAPVPIAFALSSAFNVKYDEEIPVTGSGTYTIDTSAFITAGAKAILITVDTGVGAAPVMVRANGGSASGQWEISPGGFLLLGSPTPAAGVNQLAFVYTSTGKIRVRVLG